MRKGDGEELERAALELHAEGLSLRAIATRLDVSANGVMKALRRVGVDTSRARLVSVCEYCQAEIQGRGRKFCSNEHQQLFNAAQYIALWKAGKKSGNSGQNVSATVRRYLFDKFQNKCSRCGWSEVNPVTGNVPLTVEHIDGNSSNSCEENLDLICPNCHSLTPTYGGLNKGNGRKARYKK